MKRVVQSLELDEARFPPRQIAWWINAQKDEGRRPQHIQPEARDEWSDVMLRAYAAYQERCERAGLVDFAELLLRAHELLRDNPALLAHYRHRFRELLIDEFQDTNAIQYGFVRLLAGEEGHVFVVGDDDQSIYGWRGAKVENVRKFLHDFPGARTIRLEQNYRSSGNILDAANALIGHNTKRLGKNLWTDRGAGEPIRVYEAFTDSDEARWIVEEIQSLVRDGASRSDIALLYRSNAQSRVLEHQLFSSGVAYRVYGGLRFFERQEVKHALAYLRLIANPDDDTAFTRVVNFPTRGIGARSLEALQDAARTWNTPLYQTVPHLAGKPGAALGQFVALIERLRVETRDLPLHETVDHVIEMSGLRGHYQLEKEGQERIENLRDAQIRGQLQRRGGRRPGARRSAVRARQRARRVPGPRLPGGR